MKDTDQEVRVFCKGAPELLLQKCNSILTKQVKKVYGIEKENYSTQVENLNKQAANEWLHIKAECNDYDESIDLGSNRSVVQMFNTYFAQKAYRNILFAYRDMSYKEY